MEEIQSSRRTLLSKACDYCRYRKRKCDRAAPKCSMCVQRNQDCRYSEAPGWPGSSSSPKTSTEAFPAELLGDGFRPQAAYQSDFPQVFFLDHAMFKRSKLEVPLASIRLDQTLLEPLGYIDAISEEYFSWAHLWMPIVSKRRWKTQLMNSLAAPRVDVQLLGSAMNLVLWSPVKQGRRSHPQTDQYRSLKRAFLDAEFAGLLSLPLLQAMVLTSLYELGHAIYPAAYLSIGYCVRLALALELEKQSLSELESSHYDLEEQEERRRVWWAIIILDRMNAQRPPTSPDPRPEDCLPVLDQDWDNGNLDPSQVRPVSSPSSSRMGMLARLAQAAYLHGRVLRHKNHPTSDSTFNRDEKMQLDKSLRALLRLAYQGGSLPVTTICPQTAMCFGALIELHSPSEPDRLGSTGDTTTTAQIRRKSITDALDLLRPIANETFSSATIYFRGQPFSLERASPLLLQFTYQAALTFLKLASSMQVIRLDQDFTADQSEEDERHMMEANRGIAAMMRKLALLGSQWCAADAYMRILRARITSNIV